MNTDLEFERKILEMEIPLKKFISEEEKETSWKEILLAVDDIPGRRKIIRPFYWMAAASLLIITGIVVFLGMDNNFRTTDDEKLNVNLADGSYVTLNHNSRLGLTDDFAANNRKVFLEGEAFFNIRQDKSHPFVISMGPHEVIVLGTSFNICYRNNAAEVSVRSGTVEIRSGNNLLRLAAGQKGSVSGTGKLSMLEWDVNDFSWYSGTLILTEQSLKDVALILSELFNKKVDVAPTVAACTLSAKIEYETMEDILAILKETLGIEWKTELNKVYIYGKGC
jgi:ferric-dicitrate binding protein FerR (iron transport regulator)